MTPSRSEFPLRERRVQDAEDDGAQQSQRGAGKRANDDGGNGQCDDGKDR